MKLHVEPIKTLSEGTRDGEAESAEAVIQPEASTKDASPKRFRRLKWNELVGPGDFIKNEHEGFEPWQGPNGFRASSFVKSIYRQYEKRSVTAKKTE